MIYRHFEKGRKFSYVGSPEERGTDEELNSRHLSEKEIQRHYTKKRVKSLLKGADDNKKFIEMLQNARSIPPVRLR